MAMGSGYRSRGAVGRIVGILVVIWLIIGAIAAGQRGYYGSGKDNCASVSTTLSKLARSGEVTKAARGYSVGSGSGGSAGAGSTAAGESA